MVRLAFFMHLGGWRSEQNYVPFKKALRWKEIYDRHGLARPTSEVGQTAFKLDQAGSCAW